MVSFGPLSLLSGPALGGVGCPSGPMLLSGDPSRPCGECGIGSEGISVAGFEAPEMTTRGGAGEVLSETGDRRGVVGALFAWEPRDAPSESGEGFVVRFIEDPEMGEDGPGEEEVGIGGVGLFVGG